MTLRDLIEKLGFRPLSTFEDRAIEGAYVSDMLSDVMAGAKSGDVWLTGQTHKSIVPAANLVDVSAVVVTGAKVVPQETVDLASRYGLPLLSTPLPTFEVVGKLHALGVARA